MKPVFEYLGPDDPKPMIQIIRAVDLTADQVARCKELSYGDEGYMSEDLDYILDNERRWLYRYSKAILLSDPGKVWPIHGWALVEPIYNRPRYAAQLFVDPSQRGKGYGTMLLSAAQRGINNVPLCYVDEENEGFFNKVPWLYEKFREKESV